MLAALAATSAALGSCGGDVSEPPLPPFTGQTGTILFVTQVPEAGFAAVSSTFANHLASMDRAPRGGDLWIRYGDGTLRNLTREAGFGMDGHQGDSAIAVREPAVHWDAEKAVFSMVVGAPEQHEYTQYYWQLYEVTGLEKGGTAVITKVPNQPEDFNNVAPAYGSDDRIIFASDRPRGGERHLYPQLDEYESTPTVTGLWSLDPATGDLFLLEHAPSGSFSPTVDSFGRVIFTKWDHLQRDQQADAERLDPGLNGAFTYADESEGAAKSEDLDSAEVFPEPRLEEDPNYDEAVATHRFNQFFPWMVNQDGTGEETLNHVGRHELEGSYSAGSFKDDPDLHEEGPASNHKNRYPIGGDGGTLHLREDPTTPGRYYATKANEFATASAGALIRFDAGPSVNPDDLEIIGVTHPDTYNHTGGVPGSTGHYRNPLPMSDGLLVAVHTSSKDGAKNLGGTANPRWNYEFRLRVLRQEGEYFVAKENLTPGFEADITYYNPDVFVTYKGPLWELDPVEVVARPRPTAGTEGIAAPELAVFTDLGIDPATLRAWLAERDLALIISRNVTERDRADVQQPYNLRVPGGVQTVGNDGKLYDVVFFQVFQADALRGYGGVDEPRRGRRLLARAMHGSADLGPTPMGAPPGSVALGLDGSMAAFVPARRALSWQLTDGSGQAIVRERNWVSFQPGEIRTCPVCHGVNTFNQAGMPTAENSPDALRELLMSWNAGL